MRILRTYILKEMFQPTLGALVLFTFVLMVGNLIKLADLLINRGVSPLAIVDLFALLIPSLLSYTIPMAVLTGTLIAFGRLSSDREILAMKAAGIGSFSLAIPVLMVGVLTSMALIPLNNLIVPWSRYTSRKVLLEIGLKNPTAFLEAGTFIKEFKPYILFVYEVEGNRLAKVRIYEPKPGRPARTIVAERGEFLPIPNEHRVLLRLEQGTADEPDPEDPSKFYKLEFQTYTMDLSLTGWQNPSQLGRKPKDMELGLLRQEIAKLRAQGVPADLLQIELHRRMAMAFAPLAFILIGLPLGITTRRAQRSVGLGLSAIVFVGYYLFLILGQTLAQKGTVSPCPAMWMGNGILMILGVWLMWRVHAR